MILSRNKIQQYIEGGHIRIDPFDENNLKEASYTFHLGSALKDGTHIPAEGCELQPGQFVVGLLEEHLHIDNSIACLLTVRGSCAQNGINALNSDLFVEPGWSGQLSLAITNIHNVPVRLASGMPIVKGIFMPIEK